MPKRVPDPDTPPSGGSARIETHLVVYVEGPLDRDVIRGWCYRLGPPALGEIIDRSVILGGRQPERAAQHFAALHAGNPAVRGMCVLDRDEETAPLPRAPQPLEFFTWTRRHIESYLLAPGAIERCARPRRGVDLARQLRSAFPPPDDESALRALDAKRLLGRDGPVARIAGRAVRAGRIAREMRHGEFHSDVEALFARLRILLDSHPSGPDGVSPGELDVSPRREGML